jgi:penicillin-binding protein 1A
MKKCYEDKDLQISKDPFEKPENFSIKVDCWEPARAAKPVDSLSIEEEQSTEEFGL